MHKLPIEKGGIGSGRRKKAYSPQEVLDMELSINLLNKRLKEIDYDSEEAFNINKELRQLNNNMTLFYSK